MDKMHSAFCGLSHIHSTFGKVLKRYCCFYSDLPVTASAFDSLSSELCGQCLKNHVTSQCFKVDANH